MPEGDTVYRTAHRLHRALAGKTLISSDFRVPQLATEDLSGATVEGARAVGKHLFLDTALASSRPIDEPVDPVPAPGDAGARVEAAPRRASVHSHLKMEGVWHLYRPGERWQRPGFTARVVLRTDDVEAVGFSLGILELTADPDRAVAHLGPDLLGDDWDPDRAAANLSADPALPIGLALLDQRNLAGIGNVYRSELCFLAGIHPAAPAGDADVARIVADAHRLLTANALSPVRVTTGDRRRGRELWVYGRERRACRRCGTGIRRDTLGTAGHGPAAERIVYFCPRCQ
ncbi:MAG: DNA-formamidopyrimidine glycosylase family protein [Gordonia sp. (in: high G+C Gram-positive bacteria)]|uniref:DNA-formamidopyrimidine glycosylase family protein n=1 Tax=Gordonia sp. (in: high G+C Gram-positive bacteria) TaxID=84139 RepID=UPI0039E48C0F